MNELVSIIIINWNEKEYLNKCIASLFKQTYKNIEIIVVDNASEDGSLQYIRKKFSKIKFIINKTNLGYATANNIGYKASKGKYILFLNNDTIVSKNFLIELIKTLTEDKNIGGIQSKILLMDHPDKLDAVGSFLTTTGFLYHYGVMKDNSAKYSKKIRIYSAKGACMIFKREVLEKVKVDGEVFDNDYFAYFEETDVCHRVWLAGYEIFFEPKSIIRHKMGATSSKLDNSFIQYHSFKNRISSYIKNLEIFNLFKMLPVHLVLCEIIALTFLFSLKPKLFLAINKAFFWNIKNLKKTLTKRNRIKKTIRFYPDKHFFPIILRRVRLSYYYHLFNGLEKYEDS